MLTLNLQTIKVEAIVNLNKNDLNKYGHMNSVVTFYAKENYSLIKPCNNCEVWEQSYIFQKHMITYEHTIMPVNKKESFSFLRIYKNEGKYSVTKFIYNPN